MITKAPRLTSAGESLLIRAIGGEQVTFTRFKVGSGETSGTGYELSDLITPEIAFGISDIDDSNTGFLKVNGHFDNSDVESDFQLRELGLFAEGEDEVEVLYCYVNDGNDGGLIRANEGDVIAEQDISLIVAIGEAEHVTAIIAPDTLYALKADFDAHVADDENPHGVTAAQVGLGDVPNVTTNNQTPTYIVPGEPTNLSSGERLSVAMGKIARAVQSLISHITNTENPHEVTASQIDDGILAKEYGGTGRQSDMEAAKDYRAQIFGVSLMNTNSITSWNSLTTPGVYYMWSGLTRRPPTDTNYFVFVFKTSTNSIKQLAISDDGIGAVIYRRSRTDNSWGSWA